MFTKNTWINLIIIIVIIIVVILVLINIKVCRKIDKPTVPLTTLKPKLKTGDVLVTHGCSLLKSAVMNKYLGCPATHVGMIVRKPPIIDGLPDRLYVLELGPYNNNPFRKSDVRLRSFEKVIQESTNNIFGLLPAEKEIDLSDEEIDQYGEYKFNYWVPTMFAPYKKHKVCSSFVAKIHEDKGLRNHLDDDHYLVSPCDYYNSDKMIFFTR